MGNRKKATPAKKAPAKKAPAKKATPEMKVVKTESEGADILSQAVAEEKEAHIQVGVAKSELDIVTQTLEQLEADASEEDQKSLKEGVEMSQAVLDEAEENAEKATKKRVKASESLNSVREESRSTRSKEEETDIEKKTKIKLQKTLDGVRKHYPKHKEFYSTDDGEVFLTDNPAKTHQRKIKGKEKNIQTHK